MPTDWRRVQVGLTPASAAVEGHMTRPMPRSSPGIAQPRVVSVPAVT
jgi:hypothetical protein